MSRQTKLTPEIAAKVVEHTRKGLFVTTIAGLLGVHRDSIYEWLDRGEREPDSVFGDFLLAYREAEAQAEVEALETIRTTKDPVRQRGEAWWLERRHRERYAKSIRAEVSGPNGKALQHEHTHTIDAASLALRIADAVAARAAGGAPAGGADGGDREPEPGGAGGSAAPGRGGGG